MDETVAHIVGMSDEERATYRLALRARGLPRGDYRVTVTVKRGRATTKSILMSRRL